MDKEQDNKISEQAEFQQQGSVPNNKLASQSSLQQINADYYKPTSWQQYFDDLFYLDNGTSIFQAGSQGVIFLCIHGASRCALSFSCLAKEVKKFGTLIAFDLKAHGYSKYIENLDDLSIETLVDLALDVFKKILQRCPQQNIVLVGHQLGGSIATRVADQLTNKQNDPKLVGVVVLDAVEGLALQGLAKYNQMLNSRPKYFLTTEQAIKWTKETGAIRRIQSARVSVPPLLRQIQYEGKPSYVWRIKLKRANRGWIDWFKGLSSIFLSIKIPKILVSSQHQKLDQELVLAETQGKFKHKIIDGVGHQVHEDDFVGVARMLYYFINNFKIPMTVAEVKEKEEKGIAHFHPHLKAYDPKK